MTPRARGRRARLALGSALAGTLLVGFGSIAGISGVTHTRRVPPSPTTVVRLHGQRLGPAFQGIGAISGGGGNSRYLIDYPPRERTAILDYLFAPHYGASLQLLKLEIGGGGNSSDGSEPSVEPVRGRINCNVGYEFWLAKQAVRRNPHIALYGLQWSAPSWVRGKRNSLWTAADIRYLIDWLGCARRVGLHIAYLGGWNEHYKAGSARIASWYVALRRALDANGYRGVKVVAADDYGVPAAAAWSVADDMANNPAFGRAVTVIGVHDVCGPESEGFRCTGSARAKAWAAFGHKLIWQSELGRTPRRGENPREQGPGGLARALNHGYIDAGVTGTLLWPLVEAMPADLPFPGRGLLVADQPWSGNYAVSDLVWVVAHTTQFVTPGWRFLRGAVGLLAGTGSYVTYMAPDRSAWSMVVETSAASTSQWLRVDVGSSLPARTHVWLTELAGRRRFVPVATLAGADGSFRFRLEPHAVYTFTTTTGQSKAAGKAPTVPRPRPLPTRYSAHRDAAGMATLVSPMEGSFQYVADRLTQTTIGAPVPWAGCDVGMPYAVLGEARWTRFALSVRVELPVLRPGHTPPGAILIAGFSGAGEPCGFTGYLFSVNASGRWRIVHRQGESAAVVASGQVAPARRYALALAVSGRRLTVSIDRRRVRVLWAHNAIRGLTGLGSLTFVPVVFSSFSVE